MNDSHQSFAQHGLRRPREGGSWAVEKVGNGTYRVTGGLTVRGAPLSTICARNVAPWPPLCAGRPVTAAANRPEVNRLAVGR